MPIFPEFKELEISDRDQIQEIFWNYQPEISELTFTNIYMWRKFYKFRYSLLDQWFLLIAETDDQLYAFEPTGPPGREEVLFHIFKWLQGHQNSHIPQIVRADKRFTGELTSIKDLIIEPQRNHFDYVYKTKDLIELTGKRYHSKKNHLNHFLNTYFFRYEPILPSNIDQCLEFSNWWCSTFHRKNDPILCAEWVAIRDALHHYEHLQLHGAVLWIDGRVQAFTFGELLNSKTAVIHIEKANPEIQGIYTAINQMFCEHQFNTTQFVNREQDLGDAGLRKSKNSYHPVKLVEKYNVSLKKV